MNEKYSVEERRELGINQPGVLLLQPYSLNLQRCKTGDSIGLFARNFDILIP